MGVVLLVILALLLVGAVPAYPYNRGWGYYPSGIVGLLLVLLLILLLVGAVPWGITWGPAPATYP